MPLCVLVTCLSEVTFCFFFEVRFNIVLVTTAISTLSSCKVLVDLMRGGVTDSYPVAIYVFWG